MGTNSERTFLGVLLFSITVMALSANIWMSKKYTDGYNQMQKLMLDTVEKTYITACIDEVVMYNDYGVQPFLTKYKAGTMTVLKDKLAEHCKQKAKEYRDDLIRSYYQDRE